MACPRRLIRECAASISRCLPLFPGKYRSTTLLSRLLTSPKPSDNISPIRMQNGQIMVLDHRSRAESWAYWNGIYDSDEIRQLCSLVSADSTILDIGANVGFYSLAFAQHIKANRGRGKVIAFEPIPANFERIQRGVELNGYEEIVRAYNLALSDHRGRLNLLLEHQHGEQTGNAILDTAFDEALKQENRAMNYSTVEAEVDTLDAVAARDSIDDCALIKMDIEGAEIFALRGAEAFVAKHRPLIFGEFNIFWLDRFGFSFADVEAYARRHDMQIFSWTSARKFERYDGVQQTRKEDLLLVPSESPSLVSLT